MKINLYKILVICVIFISIVFRVFIIETTPLGDSGQVDTKMGEPVTIDDYDKVLDIDNYTDEDHGHFYYILYIFKNHKLGEDTSGQMYHPPVHYILTATWLSFLDKLPLNSMQKVEGIQYIGLIYFIISLVFIFKLLDKIELKNRSKLLIIFLYCFFPKFLQMVTYITNDYLVFVLQLWCILALIKWNENPNYKNIISMAFIFGLGNLTKYNNVVMAFPIGICFLYKLIKDMKDFNKTMTMFPKIIIFGVISLFLTISYMVRCIIINGTYEIARPFDELYIGGNIINQWGIYLNGIITFNEIFYKNVWIGFLYTALVNKYEMRLIVGIMNLFLILYNFIYIIKYNKDEKNQNMKLLNFTFIVYFISYILYNIKLPYICTYNSRYILICLFLSNIYVGKVFDKIENKKIYNLYSLSIIMFCIISMIQFI